MQIYIKALNLNISHIYILINWERNCLQSQKDVILHDLWILCGLQKHRGWRPL